MAENTPSLDSAIAALKALGPADQKVVTDVLAALGKAPIDQNRFVMDFWGIEMERQANGHVLGRMPITPQALNPLGIVHGGITYTLADSAMGLAVWEQYHGSRAAVTVETKITYLAPGRGRELIADVTVLRAGQTLAYTECRIQNDEGRLIATATGTYYVWDPVQKLPD
ncbi:MAG: PaaI family thioesterase [Symbiobacteriia bacterium]